MRSKNYRKVLSEYRLQEAKDHLIKKLNITDEQREILIDFFQKHPNFENKIDWNRKDLTFEDFEEVLKAGDLTKSQVKKFGLSGKAQIEDLKEKEDYLIVEQDEDYVIYYPLTFKASEVLAKPSTPPLGITGEWCISGRNYSPGTRDQHWKKYIRENIDFFFVFTLTTKYAIARYEDDTLEPFDCKDLRTSLSLIPVNNLRKKILAFPRVLQEGGVSYYDENGVKYSSNLATLVRAPKDLKGIYEISHGTRVIEDRAFYECEELAHVKIPLSVEEIGSHAFTDCTKIFDMQLFCKITQIKEGTFEGCTNLQQIYIPRTVTSIERDVFYDCKNLKKIIYGGTYKEWKAIEKSPLWDSHTSENYLIRCRDLAVLKYTEDRFGVKFQDRGRELKKAPQTLSGTYEVPWGTEVIRRFAFYENKNLKAVILPVTLTDLKAEAFYRCGIENISYTGTKEQWNEIKKINGWFSPPKEILIHCKDGDLSEKVGRPSVRDVRTG